MAVYPSVCLHVIRLLLDGYSGNSVFEYFFFENIPSKFNFHYNLTRTTGILREDQYTFMIISSSILLKMKNVSDKSCRKNQNTGSMFNNVTRK